jgi:peptide/nickel transport system substrate-binding protein
MPLSFRPGRRLLASVPALFVAGATAFAQPADTLRVGHWDLPFGRGNPYHNVFGQPHVYIYPAIFDTLTLLGEARGAAPSLATAWKNIDQSTWQFTMRPNATFQNGEPINAEAVVKVIEWFATEAARTSPAARSFDYIASARAVDPVTVEFKTKAPRPIMASQMAAFYVVPPKAWAELGPEQFATRPVGSGPFRSTEWTGESIKMEAYRQSWRAPKVGRIEFLRLPESVARRQALVSGQIDIMIQVVADDMAEIRAAGGTVDASPSPLLLQLAFVQEEAATTADITPLKDKRVRQALNHAVDKESINENLLGGALSLNTQYSLPFAAGYNPNLRPFEHDPVKARALLAEAGQARGLKLLAHIRDFPNVFQQVAQDLSKVGVELEVRPIVNAEWGRMFLNSKWDSATFSLTLGVAPENDTIRMMVFQSCRKNPPYYCNRDLMPLIDAADAEFDLAKREKMLQDVMEKMRDDVPAIFLFEQKEVNAYGKRVRGFKNPNRFMNFQEMTLAN